MSCLRICVPSAAELTGLLLGVDDMILLLGATTYIGRAFAQALSRRKGSFIPLSRNAFDYSQFDSLFDYVRKVKPELVINAADYCESSGTEVDERTRAEMLQVNTVLPQTIARVCCLTNTVFAHVSSGSIFRGGKVAENGALRIRTDLDVLELIRTSSSEARQVVGFSEHDLPNRSFNSAGNSFYSGTKALAEEVLQNQQLYIWRFHLPFDEHEGPNNFLSQVQEGSRARRGLNSVSHLEECVGACLELWERRSPLGIYNMVNPEPIQIEQVSQMIQRALKPVRPLHLLVYETERQGGERADCVLDCSKLMRTGIQLRPALEALEMALRKWTPHTPAAIRTTL